MRKAKVHFLDCRDIAYSRRRHGDLQRYPETHNGISVSPLFVGYRHYAMLWDNGFFIPNVSGIRIMNNMCGDPHYIVVDRNIVIGAVIGDGIGTAAPFCGEPGYHDARKLLAKSPAWEAAILNMNPTQRKKQS